MYRMVNTKTLLPVLNFKAILLLTLPYILDYAFHVVRIFDELLPLQNGSADTEISDFELDHSLLYFKKNNDFTLVQNLNSKLLHN